MLVSFNSSHNYHFSLICEVVHRPFQHLFSFTPLMWYPYYKQSLQYSSYSPIVLFPE